MFLLPWANGYGSDIMTIMRQTNPLKATSLVFVTKIMDLHNLQEILVSEKAEIEKSLFLDTLATQSNR